MSPPLALRRQPCGPALAGRRPVTASSPAPHDGGIGGHLGRHKEGAHRFEDGRCILQSGRIIGGERAAWAARAGARTFNTAGQPLESRHNPRGVHGARQVVQSGSFGHPGVSRPGHPHGNPRCPSCDRQKPFGSGAAVAETGKSFKSARWW